MPAWLDAALVGDKIGRKLRKKYNERKGSKPRRKRHKRLVRIPSGW